MIRSTTLALRAATETGSEPTKMTLSVHCLKNDFADVLGLAVGLLREPEFRQGTRSTSRSGRCLPRSAVATIGRARLPIARIGPSSRTEKDHPLARQERIRDGGCGHATIFSDVASSVHSLGEHDRRCVGDFDPAEMTTRLLRQRSSGAAAESEAGDARAGLCSDAARAVLRAERK